MPAARSAGAPPGRRRRPVALLEPAEVLDERVDVAGVEPGRVDEHASSGSDSAARTEQVGIGRGREQTCRERDRRVGVPPIATSARLGSPNQTGAAGSRTVNVPTRTTGPASRAGRRSGAADRCRRRSRRACRRRGRRARRGLDRAISMVGGSAWVDASAGTTRAGQRPSTRSIWSSRPSCWRKVTKVGRTGGRPAGSAAFHHVAGIADKTPDRWREAVAEPIAAGRDVRTGRSSPRRQRSMLENWRFRWTAVAWVASYRRPSSATRLNSRGPAATAKLVTATTTNTRAGDAAFGAQATEQGGDRTHQPHRSVLPHPQDGGEPDAG